MLRKFKKTLARKLRPVLDAYRAEKSRFRPSLVHYSRNRESGKRALLCYLVDAVTMKDSDPRLKGHANWWRAREIARILDSLGYSVDVIASGDRNFVPTEPYDLVFDASYNIPRLAAWQKPETKYCMLLTGSYTGWSSAAEACRIADFETRHGVYYAPRYGWQSKLMEDISLSTADLALLVGNDVTLATYPEWARQKIKTVCMPTSWIEHRKKYGKRTGSFLYYSSARNVLKGLDLVLDFFIAHPELKLDIVGPVESGEQDFWKAYPGVPALENLELHGSMVPSSKRFSDILDRCDALLFPSCSEGASSSVLTCCHAGLYPIISDNSGVDLPPGCGIRIETVSASGIEQAISLFLEKDWSSIADEAGRIADETARRHSREAFTGAMTDILRGLRDAPERKRGPADSMDWVDGIPAAVRNCRIFGQRRISRK